MVIMAKELQLQLTMVHVKVPIPKHIGWETGTRLLNVGFNQTKTKHSFFSNHNFGF